MTAAGSNIQKGRCLVYEITLKGNYNLSIDDLGITFSPEQRVRQVSDEDYNSSADLKRFVGKYLVAQQLDNAKQGVKAQPVVTKKATEVVELKSKQAEQEPIVADGAGRRAAMDDHKPIVSNEQPKQVDEPVDALKADGASKTSAADEVVAAEAVKAKQAEEAAAKAQDKVEQVKEEVKAEVVEPEVKEEPKIKPKTEPSKQAPKKPAKKDAGKKPAKDSKKKK